MWINCRPIFTRHGLRTLAFLTALWACSNLHAGPPADAGLAGSGRSQRSGGAYVTGSLQPTGLSASHASTQARSNFIVVTPAPSTAPIVVSPAPGTASIVVTGASSTLAPTSTTPAGTLSNTVSSSTDPFVSVPSVAPQPVSSFQGSVTSGSQSFVYTTAPGQTSTFVVRTNEPPTITGNDLSPFLDVSRPDTFGIVIGRPAPPGAVGSTLDVTDASHYEATFAPRWIFNTKSQYPITVTLPTQVTLGEDPYWFGHSYGWIATGLNVRIPLSFIPSRYGKWSAGTSVELCYYGTTMTEFANSVRPQIPKLGAVLTLDL
ncbi:MAG TPA: hypothetical protein VJ719_02110 [Chthoniobacterales bacterium]|nr:hypothetical protein [Chthoniobacterales bacterium]